MSAVVFGFWMGPWSGDWLTGIGYVLAALAFLGIALGFFLAWVFNRDRPPDPPYED